MAASSEPRSPRIETIVEAASRGDLPPWTTASTRRRKHMARVAKLLGSWARERGEPDWEVVRWLAAGNLHDVLRDADEAWLRPQVDPAFRDLPGKVLHGPAAAQRLRREGVEDEELLHAITFHTLGSPDFEILGWALFAADFLEPGRKLRGDWRARLRKRASKDLKGVVKEILGARIRHLLGRGRPLRPETVAFWNRISEGEGWASASEL